MGKATPDRDKVTSTTVNNALAARAGITRGSQPKSRLRLLFTCLFLLLTPPWTMSTIPNQKGSGLGFKLVRPNYKDGVRNNLNAKTLFLSMVLHRLTMFLSKT